MHDTIDLATVMKRYMTLVEARKPWKSRFSLHVNDASDRSGPEMTGRYAAYDDEAIWGTGDTPMAARLDARQWFDATKGEAHITQQTAMLQIARMTDRLKQKVEMSGGNVSFTITGDVLDLGDDADE